jgi:hypothetical protein
VGFRLLSEFSHSTWHLLKLQKIFVWARNSISRLNEFASRVSVFRFWINHDCNGIFCCWDLSHALKQLRNAVKRIFLCSARSERLNIHKCLLLSILCRSEFIFRVNLFTEWDDNKKKTFQLSLKTWVT